MATNTNQPTAATEQAFDLDVTQVEIADPAGLVNRRRLRIDLRRLQKHRRLTLGRNHTHAAVTTVRPS